MIIDLLKKHKKLLRIFAVVSLSISALASCGVYYYLSKQRTYTASVNFRFTNSGASDGYANDGTEINFEEFRGAEVLKNAIDKFGIESPYVTVDALASGIVIEDVIPAEEQDKIDSALKNGKEYEYNPVEFKATLTTEEKEAAWLMQCIAESYYEYYAQNHIVKQRLSPIANIDKFDYIEVADLLKKAIVQGQDFLSSANSDNPDFRCSTNGYLFSDILNEYTLLYNNELPRLYSQILSTRASKDPALLVQTLQKKIVQNESNITDTNASLEEVTSLIESYSEKNKAQGAVTNGYGDLPIDENHQNIMDYVYENETSPLATYDALFRRYDAESDIVSSDMIDNAYYRYLISVFDGAEPIHDEEEIKKIESQIQYIYQKTQHLHELSREAKTENDAIQAGKVLKQLNTPYAMPSGRVTLFAAVTFVAMNLLMCIALPILWIFKRKIEEYIRENYLMY